MIICFLKFKYCNAKQVLNSQVVKLLHWGSQQLTVIYPSLNVGCQLIHLHPLFLVDLDKDQQLPDGNQQLQIGRMLPLMQRLSCFAQRCREVMKNTIQQLAALFNK